MGFPGTIAARAAGTASIERKSVDFDGSTEYLQCTEQSLGFSDQWTISYWINQTSPTTRSETAIMIRNAAQTNPNTIQFLHAGLVTNDPVTVAVWDSGGFTLKNLNYDSATASASTWTNYVATYDGSDTGDPLVFYKDGTSQSGSGSDNTGTMTSTNREITVMAFSDAAQGFFDGLMAHIIIWDTVLDQNDIDEIVSQKLEFEPTRNAGTYDKASNAIHWYKLGEQSGSVANIGQDYIGSADLDQTGNIADADISTDIPT